MAFFEVGQFCEIDEYIRGIEERIHEDELRCGEYYNLMMRLAGNRRESAAKQAIQVERVSKYSGLVAVKFAFLDEDMQPTWLAHERMRQGLIGPFASAVFVANSDGAEFGIQQGYMKDYSADEFGDALAAFTELSLTC